MSLRINHFSLITGGAASHRSPFPTPHSPFANIGRHFVGLTLLLLVCTGCEEELPAKYGTLRGDGEHSVNGFSVWAEMFESAGHEVSSWRWLTPRLYEDATTIVWIPNSYEPPSHEVVEWIDEWLAEDSDHTLIYVGRDFDAAPMYWKLVAPQASGKLKTEVQMREQEAELDFQIMRPGSKVETDWQSWNYSAQPRDVTTLNGDSEWTAGIDASKLYVELHGRLEPSSDAEVLLESEGDALITRTEHPYGGQRIDVVNGSLVFNLPLVSHENRKIAGRLVAEAAPGEVVFVESGRSGLPVLDSEPDGELPTEMQVFTAAPLDIIFLHLALLGIIFVFSRLPIFGRARRAEASAQVVHRSGQTVTVARTQVDFGQHAEALGELLRRAGNMKLAASILRHYQQEKRDA